MDDNNLQFVIITGISGAGKSQAANALEDIGYYCIDNIPPVLIPDIIELGFHGSETRNKIAVITDMRGGEMFKDIDKVLTQLGTSKIVPKLLFLDACDEVLIRRFKENRRTHPLCKDGISLRDALNKERDIMADLRKRSDFVVDTSTLTNGMLKKHLTELFLDNVSQSLMIECVSFGYKYGICSDADLVFDVRCLPNPYYIDSLRNLTGLDNDVSEYIMQFQQSEELASRLKDLLDYLIPLYRSEGKSQIVVAFGCTGGKHRSVTFAELMYKHFNDKGLNVSVLHRDIKK